jgi:hypothetical protein
MDYKALFDDLLKSPPAGWSVIRHDPGKMGGVYLLPSKLKKIMQLPNEEAISRLEKYAILFEFHVTTNDKARILARGRYNPTDKRWQGWFDLADKGKADKPRNTPNKTRSVARWDLEQIKFTTSALQTAKSIKAYLKNPPQSLTYFIGHLGQANR